MSHPLQSFVARSNVLSSLAFVIAFAVPAIAHAEDDAHPQPSPEASASSPLAAPAPMPAPLPPPALPSVRSRLRWGVGLAGAGGAGYSIGDPGPGSGGGGIGIVGELGSVISDNFAIYWAPQVYDFADRTNFGDPQTYGRAVAVQNAAIFEWGLSDHFAFGLGPSLDLAWWQRADGRASPTLPMIGFELRAEATFGSREGQPRVFVGASLHTSTVLIAGWATASLAVGVHTF